MTLESLANHIFIWVARYVAGFCLVSIAVWGISMYMWSPEWRIRVRDASVFFITTGILTLVLALRPAKTDAFYWPPITWFCFTMLIVMELLWLAFLTDAIIRGARTMAKERRHEAQRPPVTTSYPTNYPDE